MPQKTVKITDQVYQLIVQLALGEYPRESCALLGGNQGLFSSWYPLHNVAELPERQYAAPPEALFQAMRQMRERHETELGIFHSHPSSSAYPSQTDIELAFYPDATYFILAVRPSPLLRAFHIVHECVEPIEIQILAAP
ncbi:MAG TPA: M67 family metallopeptidase [Acidobacteriota bacterium]|nr:M67 family metallopeptidase [Acidobacteriota bacterium]HNB71122.1 M67 family metallopeptidase [Acidobacteriota bacterium]